MCSCRLYRVLVINIFRVRVFSFIISVHGFLGRSGFTLIFFFNHELYLFRNPPFANTSNFRAVLHNPLNQLYNINRHLEVGSGWLMPHPRFSNNSALYYIGYTIRNYFYIAPAIIHPLLSIGYLSRIVLGYIGQTSSNLGV